MSELWGDDPVPLDESAPEVIRYMSHNNSAFEGPRSWDDEIAIFAADGTKLFAYQSDGTVVAPDFDRLAEAAIIFFRNVVEIARLQGYTVHGLEENPSDDD